MSHISYPEGIMFGFVVSNAAYLMLGLVFIIACYLLIRVRRIPVTAPPGSLGWPFLGETISFLAPHESTSVGSFINTRIQRHGKIFSSHLFGTRTVVSCDLELNLFILQNEERLFLANYPKAMHGILGNLSLLIVSGDLHRRLRSVAVHFSNTSKSSPDVLNYTERLSAQMMDRWETVNKVEFCKEAKSFAFDSTIKTLLGLSQEEAASTMILDDFLTFMKGFISLPVSLPGTSYAKAVKARRRLCLKMRKIIEERRRSRKNKVEREADFLDIILSKENLNDDEIVSIMLDILLAGHETTSILMSLVVYFLANAPDVLRELTEEHRRIQREKIATGEKYSSREDFKKMDFTLKVINEAMRCGNVVKFLHRKALQDVEFKGYVIPKGWQVLPVLAGPHLDPFVHSNPFEFDPWRWTDEETSKNVGPFGGGKRLCPGAALAEIQTAFFIHHLVLRFSWKVKGNDRPVAHPYVDFPKGLPLEIHPLNKMH